ncbi:MAG: DUF3795 domain-containing protein [Thermoguttaceae bacterium]|nr:DUF3795 domain-containing protein [Thermoguttaceae bacterium]
MSSYSKKELTDSVAFCGLVCKMCHAADRCDGCRSDNNICAEKNSKEGCVSYNCGQEKLIEGCWECDEFPCDKGLFSSPMGKTFINCIRFIREKGKEAWIDQVIANADKMERLRKKDE